MHKKTKKNTIGNHYSNKAIFANPSELPEVWKQKMYEPHPQNLPTCSRKYLLIPLEYIIRPKKKLTNGIHRPHI